MASIVKVWERNKEPHKLASPERTDSNPNTYGEDSHLLGYENIVLSWSIYGSSYLEVEIRDSNCKIRRVRDFGIHAKKEEPKYK